MRLVILGAVLVGCPTDPVAKESGGGTPDETGDTGDTGETAEDTGDSQDSAGDSDTAVPTPPTPPCSGGSWGAITDPNNAVHVREDGDDASGDGSGSAPYRTLAAAVEAWEAGAGSSIALGPGTFTGVVSLSGDHGDGTSDNDIRIEGCSASETILVPDAGDDGLSILKLTGVTGGTLSGFTLLGGYRSLWICADSTATVTGVNVESGERAGIVAVGAGTTVTLSDVNVTNPVPAADYAGDEAAYGISVSTANVSMEGGGIRGATGVAFLAEGATISLTDVEISATSTLTTGQFGRGIQLQGLSTATLDTVTLDGNQDAGLFSSQSLSLNLSSLTVSNTGAGALTDDTDTTGDGIVVSQGGPDDAIYDASLFVTRITGCTVTGSARAGMVVQDVLVEELSGNTAGADNDYAPGGVSIIVQGSAQISASSPDAYEEATTALDLNWTALVVEQGE